MSILREKLQKGHITKTHNEFDQEITNPNEILQECRKCYEKLFTHDPNNSDEFDDYFLQNYNIPHIDKEMAYLCDEQISLEECSQTLLQMKNGKSPGSDGLSVEFFKMFWSSTKDLVFDSINYALKAGHLSIEQKRGIIKLIPKKDKDVTHLRNWRPISLLNTDYKLLSHMFANRLQKILDKIIHSDQNGYVKGRFIGKNIRTILDIIEISQDENTSNLITFIDYEKAFDNIEWKFLQKALRAFGFNDNFIKWIFTLYKDTNSCVINNGFTSAYFPLTRGVRQGCPLSALLFIIVVEILAIEIRSNRNINGIDVNGKNIKLCLLADDTTLFLKDLQSLHLVLNLMFMFKKSSGLKINYSKTQVLQIGKADWNIKQFKLKSVKERIYSLGTWFYKDPQKSITENRTSKLDEFIKILQKWQCRNLTLYGRIMVVKSLALSKLNFMISSFEITEDFINECQNKIYEFIWMGKPPKIKHAVSMFSYENGGIKLPHVESLVKASKAVWVKRMLNEDENWIQYLKTFLPNISIKQLLKCNVKPDDLLQEIPTFYRQIFQAWFSLHKEPTNALEVRREVIFLNQFIQIDNCYILKEKMVKENIILINHLVNNGGKFLSYNEFCQKYGNLISNYNYMSMIDAIPIQWKNILTTQNIPDNVCNTEENPVVHFKNGDKDIYNVKLSDIYWKIVNTSDAQPTCIKSWSKRLELDPKSENWKQWFTIYIKCVKDIKIRELQLKIIHRFYPCQSLVAKWDSSQDAQCNYCKEHEANILHTFYECHFSTSFWEMFRNSIIANKIGRIHLTRNDIIFGLIPYKISTHSINHMLMYAKFYIHMKKKNQERICFEYFLCYYKHILTVEKEIYCQNSDLKSFNTIFEKVLLTLQC